MGLQMNRPVMDGLLNLVDKYVKLSTDLLLVWGTATLCNGEHIDRTGQEPFIIRRSAPNKISAAVSDGSFQLKSKLD